MNTQKIIVVVSILIIALAVIVGGYYAWAVMSRAEDNNLLPVPSTSPKLLRAPVASSTPKPSRVPAVSPTPKPSPTPAVSLAPKQDDAATVTAALKQEFTVKYGASAAGFAVSVSTIQGNYAKGMVSDATGGGLWFGAKVNGEWKLVADGNGLSPCADFDKYAVPQAMYGNCLNADGSMRES